MDVATAFETWAQYKTAAVSRSLHPADDMFAKAKNGWDDYDLVGRSAVKAVLATLLHARCASVERLLDFGCGHGRVARHLRALFPSAEMHFADIDASGVDFCAETFSGSGQVSAENIDSIQLPVDFDLVWVGSVFTHLDYGRMITLWEKLYDSLRVGGALVATFRGDTLYRLFKANPEPYYASMAAQYETIGVGYQDYKGYEKWGQSLISIGRCADLAKRRSSASLIGYAEAGWANVHDVASWTKRAA